jgi:PAS domain S-box-containing protein
MAGFSDKTFTDIALDSLEDAFYVLSVAENGRLVRWNNTFNEVTGYSDEELSKMTVFDFFDEEGKKRQGDFLLLLLKDGHGKLEIDITDKNSNKIPYEFHSTLVKDPVSDEPVAVVGTGRDISKHKEWEARLKESEEKYRQIFEYAIEGIFQTSLDGKIISANPSLARMYGYDSPEQMKEEISGVATQLYADPEDREKFKKLILDTNKVEAFETLFKRRDGEKVWVSINAHTVKGESNNILFIEGTTENITARKKAEEALKESEEKYRLITDNVTDVVWIMDLTTMKRTYTSPSVYKLRGFTPEEVNNLPPDKIATPESLQRLMSVLSAEMEKERQGADPDRTTTFEVEQYNKDGSTVWTEVTAKFLRDENGTPVAITGVGRDIDERKKAEKDLRESEKMFREFADNLPEVVFEADSVGRFLYVNANAINTFGYTEEELYSGSINVVEMISEEYREQAVQRMQMILSEGYQGSSEYMARRKDGSIFPAIISTLPVVKEGVTVGLRGVLTDITLQKETEETLRQTSDYLENLLNYANAPIIVWGSDFKVQRFNHAFEHLAGYTADEVIDKELSILFPIETREKSLGKIQQTLSGEFWESVEIPILRKDGNTRIALWNSANIYEEDGKTVFATIAQGQDITDRKEWENKLKEAEKKYRELADALPQVVFELDMTGNVLYVNNNAYEMFGYSKEDFGDNFNLLRIFDETDHERIIGAVGKMADGRSDGAVREYLAKRKDGLRFPVRVYSSLMSNEKGERLGIRGILTDITEEKKYEENLKRVNKELEGYSQTVSHDLKGPITAISIAHELMARIIESKAPELMDETSEVMQISTRSLGRATRLIDSLLAMAETGEPEDTYPVDLNEKVKGILFEKKTELDAKRIEVKTDDLGKLVANPTHVYQVFSNLLQNAMRYVDSDNGLIEVKKLDENRYLVRDNGPGISEEVIDDIFVPFGKSTDGDTGLGLSIVKKIVETYGGEIKAYNDNGACFEFTMRDYLGGDNE